MGKGLAAPPKNPTPTLCLWPQFWAIWALVSHSQLQFLATPMAHRTTVVQIYACVACAATDWLQGPYIYALYDSYGISTHDIERLFVAGYGSSMVFGTIIGSVADK